MTKNIISFLNLISSKCKVINKNNEPENANEILFESIINPYFDWLHKKCAYENSKYLNTVMMENSLYIVYQLN